MRVAEGRGDLRTEWKGMVWKGAGRRLGNIALGCQHKTYHNGVRKVLRFCLPGTKLALPVCMCAFSLLQLRGRILQ